MGNIIDYLSWRGDVPFSVSPWNAVDGLLLSVLSYLDFHGVADRRGWTIREAKRIDLLMEGIGGQCVGIIDNSLTSMPIQEALERPKASRKHLYRLFDRLV